MFLAHPLTAPQRGRDSGNEGGREGLGFRGREGGREGGRDQRETTEKEGDLNLKPQTPNPKPITRLIPKPSRERRFATQGFHGRAAAASAAAATAPRLSHRVSGAFRVFMTYPLRLPLRVL